MEFEEYLRDVRQLGNKTCDLYLYYYKKLEKFPISSWEDLQKFIIRRKNTTAVRGMVKNYLEMNGVTDEEIRRILPKRAEGSKKKKKLIRPITPEEFTKLRCYFYDKGLKYGLLFDLLYQGALRRVEVTTVRVSSFKWVEWVDDPSKYCKLKVTGKGNKERIVLIRPETAEIIFRAIIPAEFDFTSIEELKEIAQRLENTDTILLRKKNGEKLTDYGVYVTIRRGSIRAIGRDVRPHELRHGRATELEKKSIPIRDIKNYLGHSRLTTTEIYLHKSGTESAENIARILENK